MPPKAKITKQTILDASFTLVRTQGIESLNTRAVAAAIGCSTQPIYSYYAGIEELRADIVEMANQYNSNYLMQNLTGDNPFLNMGLAYIEFAQRESNLFKLLFLSNEIKINSLQDLVQSEENKTVNQMIAKGAGLTPKEGEAVFLNVWLTTHGIATIQATNSALLPKEEIIDMLKKSYMGIIAYYKSKGKS